MPTILLNVRVLEKVLREAGMDQGGFFVKVLGEQLIRQTKKRIKAMKH